MKSILISIRPEWVSKILNGEKTIEIRKKFPKDYVGWVYIYCTKKEPYARRYVHNDKWGTLEYIKCDGKVVARFWVDKVGNFSKEIFGTYEEPFTYNQDDLLKKSCLTEKELDDYLQGKNGKAIHITKLEIFDKPKEISDFIRDTGRRMLVGNNLIPYCEPLKRAPESWCYIEV